MRDRVIVAPSQPVFIEHADEHERRAQIAQRLTTLGLTIAPTLDSTVALVIRTRRAAEIAALLGVAHGTAAVIDEHELDRLGVEDAEATQRTNADAATPLPFEALQLRLRALDDERDSELRAAAARSLLLDPRMVDNADRARLVAHVQAARPETAIEALATVITARRDSAPVIEAVALGRLVASGAARWPHPWSFSIELDDPRDELSSPLLSLFRAHGRYQRLCDERGCTVHRAIFDAPPWLDDASHSLPPALTLLRALEGSEAARVWFAATPLPASLPWDVWSALLGQRGRR